MFFLSDDFRRLPMVGGMLFHNRAPSLEKEFCWKFSLEYSKLNLSEIAERVLYEWTLRTFLNRAKTNFLKVKCEIVQNMVQHAHGCL